MSTIEYMTEKYLEREKITTYMQPDEMGSDLTDLQEKIIFRNDTHRLVVLSSMLIQHCY